MLIERIERFTPNLDIEPLAYDEILGDSEVEIGISKPAQIRDASSIPVVEIEITCRLEGIYVE
jgi:hypothetical protein